MDPLDELTQASARRPRERFVKVKSVVAPFGQSPRVVAFGQKYRPLLLLLFTASIVGFARGTKQQERTGRISPKSAIQPSEYIMRYEAITGKESLFVKFYRIRDGVRDFLALFHA